MASPRIALPLAVFLAGLAWAGDLAWRPEDSFGERGRGRKELREPVDVALGPDGAVAVLDRDREAVVVFSSSGRWLRTLGGTRGTGQIGMRRPTALAVDEQGRFWVVDAGNHRLVVADSEGAVLQTIGSLGSDDGRFRHPSDLTFDRAGKVYVADSGNERIQVFSPEGGFLASWDRRTGRRRDHLEKPRALAYTDQGKGGIWVLNRGWSRLERFDLEGEWEESLDLPEAVPGDVAPVALEVEPAFYRMFVSDSAAARVLVLDRRGRFVAEVAGPEGASIAPLGLAVNRRMDLFFADALGARILKYEAQ